MALLSSLPLTLPLLPVILYIARHLVKASSLPSYRGPYNVGIVDLEVPVSQRQVGSIVQADGRPAFVLQTVMAAIYYPCIPSVGRRYKWLPDLPAVAEGYASIFARSKRLLPVLIRTLLWLTVSDIEIPAVVDGEVSTNQDWPVVIFSHGMACGRSSYSTYCGELASRGVVVVAPEHRDGSCPGATVRKGREEEETVVPLQVKELKMNKATISSDDLRQAQLDFREAEILEIVKVMRHINEGHGQAVYGSNLCGEGFLLEALRGRIKIDEMTIAGHSLGATTALRSLKNAPSTAFPFRGAVILDPGKHSGRLNTDIHVPIMIVHSESWSQQHSMFFGRPHFDVVNDIARGVLSRGLNAWFITATGTSHISVTDAPLLRPRLLGLLSSATSRAQHVLRQHVDMTSSFMSYQHEARLVGILARIANEQGSEGDADKEWLIHVSPDH